MSHRKPKHLPRKLDYAAPRRPQTWREWWWYQCKDLLLLILLLPVGVALIVSWPILHRMAGNPITYWVLAGLLSCALFVLVRMLLAELSVRTRWHPPLRSFLPLVWAIAVTIYFIIKMAVKAVALQ